MTPDELPDPQPNEVPPAPGLGAASAAPPATPAVPPPPDTDPTASHAFLGRLLAKARQTQIGRMVDRYQQPAPGTAVKRLHADLKGLAQEGEPGRMWYEKSSKRILDYVQGDRGEAHKIAQLIAIYSPQTAVDVNTQNAIKAYNRAKSGQPMWAGDILERDKTFDTIKGASDYAKELAKQHPGGGGGNAGSTITKVPLDDSGKRFLFARHNMAGYENIATADRDLKAHLLMNEGIPFEGRKTNNFYRNLMVHIDPTIDQGSTQDLWMARAFGFHDDAVSNATKYDFMEKLTHKLGKELGWKPHQVQAAIWTAMKTRQEAVKKDVMKEALDKGMASMVPSDKGKPKFQINQGQEDAYSSLMRDRALEKVLDADHIKKSARDFSDFLDQNLAHVSWEATPSRSVDHMAGLSNLSPEKRADYHKRISEALQDSDGNDLLAKHLGMLSPGTVEAPGYWQGDVNPASHLQVAATRIKAAGQQPDIDTASRDLLDHYANARGLLLKQDGVGYHRPYYNPQVSKANGVEYQFEKPLSGDQIRHLGALVDQIPDTALIPSGPGTMRIINFSKMADHKVFHKAVDEALQKFDSGGITAHERLFASDGELRGNDWKANPNGEDYKARLSAAGRSDVLRFVSDVLAPKVEAVDKAFAQEHGLKRDTRLEKAIRASGSQEGVNLLRGLGRRPTKADGGPVKRDKDFYDAVWRAEQALRRKKANGGTVDMGSTPYSAGEGPPGEPGKGVKKAAGLSSLLGGGGSGSGTPGNPANANEFAMQVANDPNADPTARVFAAGAASSGKINSQGQEATKVGFADGGPVSDDQTPPPPPQQIGSALDTPSYIKPIDEGRRTLSPIGLYSHAAEETWKQPQMKGSPAQFKAMLLKRGVKPDEFKWSGYDQAFAGKNVVSKREVRDHFVKNLPKIQEMEYGDKNYDYDSDTGPSGGTKYEEHTLPGGRNYREVVLHLPRTPMSQGERNEAAQLQQKQGRTLEEQQRLADLTKRFDDSHKTYQSSHWDEPNPLLHLRMSDRAGPEVPKYQWVNRTSGNGTRMFDSEDEAQKHLATLPEKLHQDLYLRKVKKPEKILHLEELQSDWGQDAREKGLHTGEATKTHDDYIATLKQRAIDNMMAVPQKGVTPERQLELTHGVFNKAEPYQIAAAMGEQAHHKKLWDDMVAEKDRPPAAPYIDSTAKWTDLGLKRALHEAAKGGYDKLVVTPGEEQAKRYDLSKRVKEINYSPAAGDLVAHGHGGSFNPVMNEKGVKPEDLHKYIGKEAAQKLMHPDNKLAGVDMHILGGDDLKVGGEGMKGFYDTILPKALEKLAKQHDPEARVQVHGQEIAGEDPLRKTHNNWEAFRSWLYNHPKHGPAYANKDQGHAHLVFSRQEGKGRSPILDEYLAAHPKPKLHELTITPRMRASILAGQKGYASGGRVSERLHDDIYQKLRKTIDVGGRYP